MRGRRASPGFTLLETLLALALTGLVLGVAYRAVVDAVAARAAVSSSTAAVERGRRALLDVAAALEGTGPATVQLGGPAAASTLRLTAWEPEPRTVTWTIEDGALVRRERSPLAAPGAPDGAPAALLSGVARFAVRAFDGRGWVASWDDARPPRALSLILEPDGAEPLEIRVTPPVREATP